MNNHGSVALTADSAVGTSGNPIRVFSATWTSGATAGILQLRNGTADTADSYTFLEGTAYLSKVQTWEGGLRFPKGCFYDHDSNIGRAVIEYVEEK